MNFFKFKHELNPCSEYQQGYCPDGPNCNKAHIRKKLCINYSYGFCPKGPRCGDAHPKVLLISDEQFFRDMELQNIIKCHTCQKLGHKSNNCPQKLTVEVEAVCGKCKKWHYKDNQCETELEEAGAGFMPVPVRTNPKPVIQTPKLGAQNSNPQYKYTGTPGNENSNGNISRGNSAVNGNAGNSNSNTVAFETLNLDNSNP